MSAVESSIRLLNSKDASQVLAVFRAATALLGPEAPRWTDSQVLLELQQADCYGFEEGELTAFVFIRKIVDTEAQAHFEISFLATHPKWRKRGQMRALLEYWQKLQRLKHLQAGKVCLLWLEVHENNLPAQALYEKTGFVRTGRRDSYYSDGAAAVLYSYSIP